MQKIIAKKSLGQNFLHNTAILAKITDAGLRIQTQKILEIGPGLGALTKVLLEKSPETTQIIAIEKDNRLIPVLNDTFSTYIQNGKLSLIHKDILEFDPKEIGSTDYTVVANIPYYITGEILKKFLENEPKPRLLILLVQKEVADRIMARQKHTILSTITQIMAQPRVISVVGRHNFSPQPNVDSAILELIPHSNVNVDPELFLFIKKAFHSKRKTIVANLRDFWDVNIVKNSLTELNIPLNARAEDMQPEFWSKFLECINVKLSTEHKVF